MNGRRYPPFGKQYLEQKPSAGLWIAIGPGAWDFAKSKSFPVLVLPDDAEPSDFKWPMDGGPVLVHERGQFDDDRLRSMAEALIRAGASSVVAIREVLLDAYDPCVFYDREVVDVAA